MTLPIPFKSSILTILFQHINIDWYFLGFGFQVSLMDLQHLQLPLKLTFTRGTNTTATGPWTASPALFLPPPVRTLTSVTWTSQSSAPTSSAPSTDSTSMSLTSTYLPTAMAPLFLPHQTPAMDITILLDPSSYPAATLTPTAFPLGHPNVRFPLECRHPLPVVTFTGSKKTLAKGLRSKLSR